MNFLSDTTKIADLQNQKKINLDDKGLFERRLQEN